MSECKIIGLLGNRRESDRFESRLSIDLALSFGNIHKRTLVYEINVQNESESIENCLCEQLLCIKSFKKAEALVAEQLNEHVFRIKSCNKLCINNADFLMLTHEIMSMNYAQVNNITGMPYAILMETAQKYALDYLILDVRTDWNCYTRSLLFSSDYFITCLDADQDGLDNIRFLSCMLLKESHHMQAISTFNFDQNSVFKMPKFPKYIGYILYHKLEKKNPCVDFIKKIEAESKNLKCTMTTQRLTRRKLLNSFKHGDLTGVDSDNQREKILDNIQNVDTEADN